MKRKVEVVTIGECMALVYPDEPIKLDEAVSLKLDMAGAESNLAIALARLNHHVRFISRLGKDPFGEMITNILKNEGVITDALLDSPGFPTGLFFREWLSDGQRRVYYYRKGSAASHLSPLDLREEWFSGTRVFHFTGITPALSTSCLNTCYRAIDLAKKHQVLISFDPNYRSPLWDHATAREVLIPLIQKSDILLLGHEDALALFDEGDDFQILNISSNLGPKIIIFKRAERGSIALIENEIIEVDACPVSSVLDPVGAGDGFDAGFLAGWLRGWGARRSLELAAKVGAMAVTTMGDYHGYPHNDQVS